MPIGASVFAEQEDEEADNDAERMNVEVESDVEPTELAVDVASRRAGTPVAAEESATVDATVRNTGDAEASDVVLTFELADGLEVDDVPASCEIAAAGGLVTCDIGALDAGDSQRMSIGVAAEESGTYLVETSASGANAVETEASVRLEFVEATGDDGSDGEAGGGEGGEDGAGGGDGSGGAIPVVVPRTAPAVRTPRATATTARTTDRAVATPPVARAAARRAARAAAKPTRARTMRPTARRMPERGRVTARTVRCRSPNPPPARRAVEALPVGSVCCRSRCSRRSADGASGRRNGAAGGGAFRIAARRVSQAAEADSLDSARQPSTFSAPASASNTRFQDVTSMS